MAGMELVFGLGTFIRIGLDVADLYAREFVRGFQLYQWYGPSGIALSSFGSRITWRIQAQILGQVKDEDALAFKTSVYNECTMIAVASAIVAQIAITGLSLNALSQTHWVARAGFVLSLTFALMAVYYATTQQRTLGRLLKAKHVRLWIRGGSRQSGAGRIVPSLEDILTRLRKYRDSHDQDSEQARRRNLRLSTPTGLKGWAEFGISLMLGRQDDFRSCDPDDYVPDVSNIRDFKSDIIYHCFTPSVASVITISAPQMLLSSSLAMLLIALAIYFGFLWTRNLDQNAGPHDSRNIFVTYIIGLAISGLVYSISKLFQDDEKRSERQIVEGYLHDYVAGHPEEVSRWGVDAQLTDGVVSFTERARNTTEHDAETLHSQEQGLINEGSS